MEGATMAILSNGGQLLTDEYRLLHNVGPGIADLRDDLDTMTALLTMHSEAAGAAAGYDDHFVRVWMNQLRELAYDTDDCIDLYKLRIKSRPTDGVLLRLKRLFGTFLARRRLAGEIAALRTRAVSIGDRHARFGGGVDRDALRRRRPTSSSTSAPPPAHALHERHHHPVGIEDQAEAMAKKLVVDDGGESPSPMVLSIVGFGGLGKTTLAKEVCRRVEEEFPYQAMVSVSQAFEAGRDLEELCKRVLDQMEKVKAENARGTRDGESETTLLADRSTRLSDNKDPALMLKEFLKDKRYLIVIDDVWTIRAWDAIQSILLLQENNSYSRIIVTTRIETVAKACSPAIGGQHHIHQMQRLKPEDSKKLFHIRTFGNKECPKELASTTEKILRRCVGLPLAIVSIPNVLAGYTSAESKYKWESICNSMGSQMESNPTLEGMKQIITLSYNHLSHELKACMMYLSIFPEDYEIDKYRLLCRWIAEGLVMERRGLTLMEVAESYLDELVSRNMIELRIDFDYYWRLELCRVHDMLLEVMVSKSLESNFISFLGGQYARLSYGRIRRLSIQRGNDDIKPPQDTVEQQQRKKKMPGVHWIEAGMDVKHARSLSMFQHQGKKLLDRIDKFTLLRVLDLEGCKGISNHHMKCVCGLYLLKFLNLRGTDIKQVPPEIKKLEHLQTLDVRDTRVEGLPNTMKELYNLERLQISHNSDPKYMWRLPLGLNKMKALREVAFSTLGNDAQVAEEIGDLEHLEELSVYAHTAKINDSKVLPALAKSLSKSYSLRRLIIGDVSFAKGALDFLHEMPQPPRLLRYLMIAGGINGGLPSWIRSLAHLVQFSMSWGQLVSDQLFDTLCELPSLKIICVHQMCYIDHELVARAKHRFLELSDLRVSCNYEEPNVLRFEEGSMAKLETLLFNFVDFEKRIVGIEHLTGLKEVHLWGKKDNPALERALEQMRVENQRRGKESIKQFQITVKYE